MERADKMNAECRKGRKGWQGRNKTCPHKGKRITVDPLKKKKDILAIKEILEDRPRDFALFTVGINTGLRGSDLLRLKFKDVLTPEETIVTALQVKERKTGNHRRIILCAKARRALKHLLPEDGDIDFDDYIFPSRKRDEDGETRRITIQRLHQLINQWCKEAGVKGHFGSHTLRKTYGYQHFKRGAGIGLLMRIFGHSSPGVTMRYIGTLQEEIDETNLRSNF